MAADMMQVGTSDIGKYPFLQQAGQYLKDIDILTLGTENRLIEIAMRRLNMAAHGLFDDTLEPEYLHELKIFALELLICRYVGIQGLMRKFALSEARRVEAFLERDMKAEPETTVALAVDILRHEFGMQFVHERIPGPDEDLMQYVSGKIKKSKKTGKPVLTSRQERQLRRLEQPWYGIRVPQYLMIATKFQSEHWKLINRIVHRGYVWLTDDSLVRLARNTLQQKIAEKIMAMKPPALSDFPKHFQLAVKYFQGEMTPIFVHKINFAGQFPPCINHVIVQLNKGENVSHSGRLLLAMYMIGIGKDPEDVVAMFQNAPDFNYGKTKYHVESLAGKRGGHEYNVMGCQKVKMANLCFPDQKCEFIKNPMQYGRNNRSDLKQ